MGRTLLYLQFLLAVSAGGQVISSNIVGDVTDASGAGVPGATIVITNIGTSAARQIVSDPNGSYVVPQLPPVNYRISATHAGLGAEVANMNLPVNQTVA